MEHGNDSERREYFRITDRLPLEFRSITREELARLEGGVKYNSSLMLDSMHELHFLRENIVSSENKKDTIHAYLYLLDKKMDTIIEILSKSKNQEIYTARYLDVDIGGAGVRFMSDVHLKEGAYIDLRIILPVFPYPKVTALCEVRRSKEVNGNESEHMGLTWQTALAFLTISEKDRDFLINYIFLKEREGLRSRNEETGR